jgi:hypothetical protein
MITRGSEDDDSSEIDDDSMEEDDDDDKGGVADKEVGTKEVLSYAQRREANIASLKVICDDIKAKYRIHDNLKPKTVLPKVVSKKKKDVPVVRRQSGRLRAQAGPG